MLQSKYIIWNSLSLNPTAETYQITALGLLKTDMILWQFAPPLFVDVESDRFASDIQMEIADFIITTAVDCWLW